MNAISMDKQYRTRDGREVRVLAVDAAGACPVVALAMSENFESLIRALPDGRQVERSEHPRDLIEAKPERTLWYVALPSHGKATKEEAQVKAREYGDPDAAVVSVTFRPGDGL